MSNKERDHWIPPRKKSLSCNFELESYCKSWKKKENLNSKKYILETLLGEVKNCQISLLTNTHKPTNQSVKSVLIKLNKNLMYLVKEQKLEKEHLEKAISTKKAQIQNQMLSDYRNDKSKTNNKYNKNKTVNVGNLKCEIELLKTFNFKAENDINQINNMIFKITNDYNYLKVCMKYLSIDEKENLCLQPKYYPFISKILSKQIDDIRNKYKLILSTINLQKEELERTKYDIIKIKKIFERKRACKEIINEDSKESKRSLSKENINKNINECVSLHNKKKGKKEKKEKYIQYDDNIIIVDTNSSNSLSGGINSSSISSSYSINKNKNSKISIKNLIKPNINVNINLNLHFNRDYHITDIMTYNTQRNKKEKEKDNLLFLYNAKRKKGLSSTDSLPYLMINNIKNSVSHSRNNKSKLNKISFFDKNVSNSNEIINKEYLITF